MDNQQLQRIEAPPPEKIIAAPELPAKDAVTARVDQVSGFLGEAYKKAGKLKITDDQAQRLQAPFPDDAIRRGAKGDETLLYIEHAHFRERLNEVFGPTRWIPVVRRIWAEDFRTAKGEAATRVYEEVVLVVNGCYAGEAIGAMVYYPNNPKSDYSEAAEGAQSEAIRRICKSMGIGLQVYHKDFQETWLRKYRSGSRPETTTTKEPPPPPPAPVWPVEAWLSKKVVKIDKASTSAGRPYRKVIFDGDDKTYSCFHAMDLVKPDDQIWVVLESRERKGVMYHNIADWQPDKGEALPEHKAELLKRAQAEGVVVLQELTALGIEKGWLIPNVETAAELPLKHVPRDLAGIESLIEILKVRLGA